MLQACDRPYLPQEALRAQGRGKLRVKHLERDVPVMPEIPRQVDSGHAATAELSLDVVAVQEGGLQAGCVIGQRRSRRAHP